MKQINMLCTGSILLGLTFAVSAAPHLNEVQDISLTAIPRQAAVLADIDNDGLSDGLQKRMAAMAQSESVDVIVTFSGPATNGQSHAAAVQQKIGNFKIQRMFTLIHGFKATMTVGQALALSRLPDVFRVQEDSIVTTQLSGATSDFGAVSARTNFGVNGNGVGICIVDTGIDPDHEQFAGRSIGFYDAISGKVTPYDDHGHGTHVAAIALGKGGTGSNLNIVGVAPAASIFSAKVLDAQGSGSESQVIGGIEYCANQADVHIISMSLGTAEASDGKDAMSLTVNCSSDHTYSSSCVNSPLTYPKIVVIAAGNSGSAPGTVGSPGAAEKAITVGAVTNWTEDGKGVYLAAFSSRGPTLDGRIKPDIASPGVRILSAKAGTAAGYVSLSGTSMATPFTAGAIALMVQKNSAIKDFAIPADEVRKILKDSAQDRGILDNSNNLMKPDNEYGAGLLDVKRAVAQAGGSIDPANSTSLPGYHRFPSSINNAGGSKVFGPFTITTDDISKGIPLAATVTTNGRLVCAYGVPAYCDLLGGWEWDPDFDLYILDKNGNRFSPGAGDITSSECALSGEYCGVGRQETVYYKPLVAGAAGEYYIQVYSYSGGGDFLLEVSKGPLTGITASPSNQVPIASFTESCTNLSCIFTDKSTDNDGVIKSWYWNFGDGYNSTLQNPSHSYANSGDYQVSLTVTDDKDANSTSSHIVKITNNLPPIADAGGPYEGIILRGKRTALIQLDGSGSTDPNGKSTIKSYAWTIAGKQLSGEVVSFNFKAGTYTVILTVTDDGGLTHSDTATVTITK